MENNIGDQTRRRVGPRLHGDSCELPGDSVIKVTPQETLGSSQEINGTPDMTTPVRKEKGPPPQKSPVGQGPDFSDLVGRVYNTSDDGNFEDEGTSPRTEHDKRADSMDRGTMTPIHWQLFHGDESDRDMEEEFTIYMELKGEP